MSRKLIVLGLLSIGCLSAAGCVTTGQEAPPAEPAPAAQQAAPEVKEEVKPVDPCEAVINDAVAKARTDNHTVKVQCGDKAIETNPMWALDYDGSVKLRLYDAQGNLLSEETRKP
ncbi:MAG: hypothetical protein AB1568_17615 [Thermodesulfobacteriota bacterium]